ncbi:hypothetical protein JCM5350_000109 [Sporobolomyces pararoseus]
MGNSASKATNAAKPAVASSTRTAGLNQQPLPNSSSSRSPSSSSSSSSSSSPHRISETKNEAIMSESRDDDLARNLASLGQVRVPGKGMASPLHVGGNAMLGILQERQKQEDQISSGVSNSNQLSARSLSNLLDDRKLCKTVEETVEVAKEYGIDPELVKELSRNVNSPSISRVLKSNDPDEDDRRLAKWVDAPDATTTTTSSQPRLGA